MRRHVAPLPLVSGTGSRDSLSITFMNAGKLPIRRLEFNCKLIGDRSDRIRCDEETPSFSRAGSTRSPMPTELAYRNWHVSRSRALLSPTDISGSQTPPYLAVC